MPHPHLRGSETIAAYKQGLQFEQTFVAEHTTALHLAVAWPATCWRAGLALRSPAIVGLAVLFLLLVHLLVLLYEEPVLDGRFGDPYRRYKSAVHRWLPRSPQSNASP